MSYHTSVVLIDHNKGDIGITKSFTSNAVQSPTAFLLYLLRNMKVLLGFEVCDFSLGIIKLCHSHGCRCRHQCGRDEMLRTVLFGKMSHHSDFTRRKIFHLENYAMSETHIENFVLSKINLWEKLTPNQTKIA